MKMFRCDCCNQMYFVNSLCANCSDNFHPETHEMYDEETGEVVQYQEDILHDDICINCCWCQQEGEVK